MFRVKCILDYFQIPGASGPTIEINMRAKWLSALCPEDLEIAFAPFPGSVPLYDPQRVTIVGRHEPDWWDHYFFSFMLPHQEDIKNYSVGPSLHISQLPSGDVPLVCSSQYFKEALLSRKPELLAENLIVIPNMVDPDLFFPGEKAPHPIVGWIGYDNPSQYTKGAEVMPYLAKRFPDIQFEMIHARAPHFQKEWMPVALPNLKIVSEVAHRQIADVIRRWSVFISGSKWENCPNAVLEVMACGVPVIAAGVGGIPEIAQTQVLMPGMRWGHPPQVAHPFDWTEESLERYADALADVLQNAVRYRTLVQDALQESQKASPHKVCAKWFDFMYRCRDGQR